MEGKEGDKKTAHACVLARADLASFLKTNFMILSFSSDCTQDIPRSHSLVKTKSVDQLVYLNRQSCSRILARAMLAWPRIQFKCLCANRLPAYICW